MTNLNPTFIVGGQNELHTISTSITLYSRFYILTRAFHDIRWQDLQLGLLIRLTHPCVQVHCVCILFLLFSLIAKYNLTIRTRAISNPITLLKSANHPYVFYSYGCCNTLYKSDRKSSHPSALHYGQKNPKKWLAFIWI